jgi:hypothetical protein
VSPHAKKALDDPLRLFAFDLAKELGRVDVDAMLAEVPLALMYEWMEYASRKPFGEERADLRSGIIAATIANANRGKGGKRFKPSDFMPKFGRRARRQTPEQIGQVMEAFMRAQNAVVERRKSKRG